MLNKNCAHRIPVVRACGAEPGASLHGVCVYIGNAAYSGVASPDRRGPLDTNQTRTAPHQCAVALVFSGSAAA